MAWSYLVLNYFLKQRKIKLLKLMENNSQTLFTTHVKFIEDKWRIAKTIQPQFGYDQ